MLSVGPSMGLDPMTLGSWPELKSRVRRSTNWATRVPLSCTSFNWSITQLYTLKILMLRCGCSCFYLVIGHNFNYEIGRQKFNSCVVKFIMVVLFAWLSFIVHSLYFYARAWRTFHLFLRSVVLGFHLKLLIHLEWLWPLMVRYNLTRLLFPVLTCCFILFPPCLLTPPYLMPPS